MPPARKSPGSRKRRQSGQPRQRQPRQKSESRGSQPDSRGSQSPPETSPTAAANEAAASSRDSSPAAASSPLLGNAGPAFEGRQLGAEPAGDAAAAAPGGAIPIEVDAWWTPERARYLVEGQGAITHALIGVGQTDWVWQDAELRAVDRPLAGALNEIEPLRRLAPYADAIGALMGVAAYVGRSRRERAAVLAGQLPREAPVTGVDAGGQAAQPTQPMQPSEDAAIRRRAVVDRVLGARDRAPEEPQAAPADAPGAEINWRVGE